MDAIEQESLQADSLEDQETLTTQDDGAPADAVDAEPASEVVVTDSATSDDGGESEGAVAAVPDSATPDEEAEPAGDDSGDEAEDAEDSIAEPATSDEGAEPVGDDAGSEAEGVEAAVPDSATPDEDAEPAGDDGVDEPEDAEDSIAEPATSDEGAEPAGDDAGSEAEDVEAAVPDSATPDEYVEPAGDDSGDEAENAEDSIAEPATSDEGAELAEDAAPDSAAPAEDAEPAGDDSGDEAGNAEEIPESAPRFIEGTDWYFVHTYSGYENKVKNYLDQRIETMGMHEKIFQVIVPTEEEVEIRDGQKRSTRRRVFPGYILVQLVLDEESWYVVRNTPGVTGFVGTGTRPVALSEDEVDTILDRMEEEQPRIKVSFRVGETVRITEGPFADFMAVVDNLYPEQGKVRVLVSFFGRETPVEMDFLQVEQI